MEARLINFCNFPILNAETVLVDFKSVTFLLKSMVDCGRYKADESQLTKLLVADVGYYEL